MRQLEVTNFSVRLKLTKEIEKGTYKSVEIGATALVTPDEEGDWRGAQRDLYAALRGQLNALWHSNGNGNGTPHPK